ncbi:MAG: T9SS type A sorting domain-containing protein [Lewinellaceae bacterium]|nr:T9SS type A sorting domain-containing protein [Lewinellaceae bacterium]
MLKKLLFLSVLLSGLTPFRAMAQPDPCDPPVVNQLVNDLIAEGFDCLNGAGPFACVDDVLNYAFENCPPVIDTTWGNPCDPAVVAQLTLDLIDQGADCLVGAGPFDCVDDVFDYAFANCPPGIDTTWGNPCDSALVAQLTLDLIDQGADCLIGAGPFDCVNDVFEFVFENCPPPIDTTWGNSCDSAMVAQLTLDLIDQGFDCLVGAGPFDCVNDVFEFVFENCPPPIDTTWGNSCDSAMVAQLTLDLIDQGFDCLVDAGPFPCVDDVFEYAFENCPVNNGDDCDPAAVSAAIDDLIAQGYDCLIGAGPFNCVHDVLCYALDNCPLPMDTAWYDVPACLLDLPAGITTFQQFLTYLVDNCDSTVTGDIPACWLGAPVFDNDADFFEWIMENCPDGDSLIFQNDNQLMRSFFAGNTTAAKNLNTLDGLTLSPNPANTDLEIRLNSGEINRIEMLDLTGRQVLVRQNVNQNRVRISLTEVPSGIYMARVFDQQNRIGIRKVVKQ